MDENIVLLASIGLLIGYFALPFFFEEPRWLKFVGAGVGAMMGVIVGYVGQREKEE